MGLVLEHKDAIVEFNFALTKLQKEVYNNGEPKTDDDWKNIIFCSLYEGYTSSFCMIDKEEINFQSGLCKSVSFVAGMCICKEKYKENAPEFFMCGS